MLRVAPKCPPRSGSEQRSVHYTWVVLCKCLYSGTLDGGAVLAAVLRRRVSGLDLIRGGAVITERVALVDGSPKMQAIRTIIENVADTDAMVLLRGESGVGKDLVARTIHAHSTRRDRPFVKVNCAAIPHGLLESELFGHEKGAFTGAHRRKPGQFE